MLPLVFAILVGVSSGQQLERTTQTDFICPETEQTGAYPHETFCDKYYECVGGEPSLVTCEDGLGFDFHRRFHAGKCDDFSNIDCGNRTELQEPKPSADDVCPRQHGRFTHPDPGECARYVVCKQGRYVIKDCSAGLHFDPIASQCTWPHNANRQDCQTKKKKAADGWECPTQDTTDRDPALGPVDPNPTYPHSTECNKFYVCIGGVDPRLNACAFGLVYDIDVGKCVDAQLVADCANWYNDEPVPDKSAQDEPALKRPGQKKERTTQSPSQLLAAAEAIPVQDFQCPHVTLDEQGGNPHPTFPHSTDCAKFYVCIDRITPRLNQCPSETVYNIDTGVCDNPKNVPDCADWYTS